MLPECSRCSQWQQGSRGVCYSRNIVNSALFRGFLHRRLPDFSAFSGSPGMLPARNFRLLNALCGCHQPLRVTAHCEARGLGNLRRCIGFFDPLKTL
jgi:hypothetical protein